MVLVTVRVLPFLFLTVVLICSVTLLVSTLGVRSYSDQRYSSMQMSPTRHSSSGSTARATGCASSSTGSGLNRDTSGARFSGASVAETLARPKVVSRASGSAVDASAAGAIADASAGSPSSRWDAAPTEAMARASSAPTGPASALATLAAPAAARFQIGVAGVSIPDHSKPPIAAAAHNSASANRRGLAIARLPPFGYPKARRTAGTRWDDCPLTAASRKARKLRVIIFRKGVVEMQRIYRILGNRRRSRVSKRRKDARTASSKSGAPVPTRWMCIDAWAKSCASYSRPRFAGPILPTLRSWLKGAVAANGASPVTSISWLRAKGTPSLLVRSRRYRVGVGA